MPDGDIKCKGLPSKGAVLRNFVHYHLVEKKTISESTKLTVINVIFFWEKARVPTKRIDSCQTMVRKLYDDYCSLKKSRVKVSAESARFKEDLFKADLGDLFDIAHKDAMALIPNDEDRRFLTMSRQDLDSCSMAGMDVNQTNKELRRQKRDEAEARRREKAAAMPTQELCESDVEESEEAVAGDTDDADYEGPSSSPALQMMRRRGTKKIITPKIAAALDRVNLPSRGATYVTAAIAQGLGVDVADVVLSPSTNIRIF